MRTNRLEVIAKDPFYDLSDEELRVMTGGTSPYDNLGYTVGSTTLTKQQAETLMDPISTNNTKNNNFI